MEVVAPFKEGEDFIKEAGGEVVKLCFQCGLCTTTCPWNIVRNFIVRKMLRQAQFGLADFDDEEWWLCTTCNACVRRCPRGVGITDVMEAIRRIMVQSGIVPASLHSAMASLGGVGNPMREEREKRADWAQGLEVKAFTQGTELLYFPCCVPAYDSRVRNVARATANILQKVGVDFGILGVKESCCGESVRKGGNESVFLSLAQSNIDAFVEAGVKKIVVTSPHCYSTFKSEYPELGGNFEVIHFTQYLAELLREGKLKLEKELKKRVVYQDPCYLGRHHGIYDEPREVLSSIPGLELVEFPDYRESSICCGGGGGRIWMDTKKGERFSDIRLEEAVELGGNILAVACPYCMLNFENSVLTVDKGDVIEVKDISELVQEAM
ncbi:putative iron-sulfur-binding oxidoreductase FadF [subsurface metagenome]